MQNRIEILLKSKFNVITKYFDPTLIEIFNDTSWIVKINDFKNDI